MKKQSIMLIICLLFALTTACAEPDLPGEEYPSNGTLSDETESRELESGEWPRKFSPHVSGTYELEVGQVIDWVYVSFSYEPDDEYISEADYSVIVVAEDPEIVEIVSYDRDKLLSYSPEGAIVIKGLKTGTTRIKYSVIYDPTGGAYTSYATVTVVDPAATQPVETTS